MRAPVRATVSDGVGVVFPARPSEGLDDDIGAEHLRGLHPDRLRCEAVGPVALPPEQRLACRDHGHRTIGVGDGSDQRGDQLRW